MTTIPAEKQAHIEAFFKTFWTANTEETTIAREILQRSKLSLYDQQLLLRAIAQFTVTDVYYDQVLKGPVPGADGPNVVLTEHGQRLLEILQTPPYVATTEVAQVFLLLQHMFQTRLPANEWEGFERCLRTFEILFNDSTVQYHMQRSRRHQETTSARFLDTIDWLRQRSFPDVDQLVAQLRKMPIPLLERFVLFLEDYQDQYLPTSKDWEHLNLAQISGCSWWQQLIEFVEAREPKPAT